MPFWELRVPVSAETSEGLTNFLWEQGALGVVEEEGPGASARLRAFYPDSASSTALVASVNAYRSALGALGFAVSPVETELGPLLEAEWASAWQQSFPPRPIGARLLILPPWERPADATRLRVVIEPGRAFGTGHHGSTESCLDLLDTVAAAWDEPGRAPLRVLDVGTGTGILAIAAVRLGAPAVRAIDVDPDAVAAAEKNAALNECGNRVAVALGGLELVAGEAFELVLANILAHTHLALAPAYARAVAPGGALILGGMLADEDARVSEAVARRGFSAVARAVVDGWAALLLRRGAA